MRVAICDDDKNMCLDLNNYISKYLNNKNIEFLIDTYIDGASFLQNFSKSSYDVIFLDIYLTDMLGIDIAHKIRDLDEDVIIIFSTSSLYHTLDGFEVNATHYLIKPVDYTKVSKALDRCKSITSTKKQYINVSSGKNELKILINDILYIEVYNTMSTIHTKNSSVDTYMSLSKFEELLKGYSFLRTHRSYLVNMKFIDSIVSDGFLLINDVVVPIKTNGRKAIKEIYLDYLFNFDE